MSKFKIGDLALIIKTHQNNHLIGNVVTIKEIISKNVNVGFADGRKYRCSENSCVVQFSNPQDINYNLEVFYNCNEALITESNLMPLKGDFTDEEEVKDVLLSLSN